MQRYRMSYEPPYWSPSGGIDNWCASPTIIALYTRFYFRRLYWSYQFNALTTIGTMIDIQAGRRPGLSNSFSKPLRCFLPRHDSPSIGC